MPGRSPKAVNAEPGPESSKCRTEARCSKCGVETQKWGRNPMSGRSPKVGPKPDAGLKPDAINAGPKPDGGPKPNAGPKPNSGAEARCSNCGLDRKMQEM
ncbi:hypothetical protein CDL15_Pgr008339 [Punica granatum]|uniref:Uncharacterized protein n=1 Tax=Punica granatum TaxID=22663 RepID=A0A218XUF9_PUNGR|nr:hypothetical protein CDL15_Pgr008339 [Punica granatum]PKI50519.1 hypothetical protein CRG98_029073 [Punica granatum]